MKTYITRRIPLIMISGIFIIMLYLVNVGGNQTQSVLKGMNHVMTDAYHIYGEITIEDLREPDSLMNQVRLMYKVIIDQNSDRMIVEPFMMLDVLEEEKNLGMVYRDKNSLIYKMPDQEASYIKKELPLNTWESDSDAEDMNQLLSELLEQVNDMGQEIVTISRHTIKQKVATRKLTLTLTQDDIINVYKTLYPIDPKQEYKFLEGFIGDEAYHIELQLNISGGYIYQLTCILQNSSYRLMSTNRFENYEKAKSIEIPVEAYEGKSMDELSGNEIEDIINNLFEVIS